MLWRVLCRFWLSKWDFSRLFYTERSWRGYSFSVVLAELPRAKRAQRSTMRKKMKKTTHPRKFGNQYTDRPPARPPARETVRPHHRATNVHSYFGSTGRLILHTHCTSMLWSVDSCQNRISTDQSHLTVSQAQVSTYRGRVSFWSYPMTSY